MNHSYGNPLNRQRIQVAVKLRQTAVKLHDGRTLSLDYEKRPGSVYFAPLAPILPQTSEFVPQGYIEIEKIEGPLWFEAQL